MNATVTAPAAPVQTGDLVWGRPVRAGKTLARRKGVVLGRFADNADQLVIWWYGMGDATADNVTMMFRSELTKAGDIFEFGGRKASQLAVAANTGYGRARSVRNALAAHARRMLSIGVK